MLPNQIYFFRNRGSWDWRVEFEMLSWNGLWRSDLSFFSRFSLSALLLAQRLLGDFSMCTHVELAEPPTSVRHTTRIKTWGVSIYRSEKTFALQGDGYGLRLEGAEYFWPLNFWPVQFESTTGTVQNSTTRASYKMPIARAQCDCLVVLEPATGHMDISMPWLRGRFSLTEDSHQRLIARFQETP